MGVKKLEKVSDEELAAADPKTVGRGLTGRAIPDTDHFMCFSCGNCGRGGTHRA